MFGIWSLWLFCCCSSACCIDNYYISYVYDSFDGSYPSSLGYPDPVARPDPQSSPTLRTAPTAPITPSNHPRLSMDLLTPAFAHDNANGDFLQGNWYSLWNFEGYRVSSRWYDGICYFRRDVRWLFSVPWSIIFGILAI